METTMSRSFDTVITALETKYRDIADGNIALLVVPPVW